MRTVTYGAACSLDGFIAASDGSLDWLHFSKDVERIIADYWATIDVILMGRKTWAASAGQDSAGPSGAMTTYLFSRTLTESPDPAVRLVREPAVDFVRTLKKGRGKGICLMGGGDFARTLFEADLIDEVGVNIHPILLGAGIPLFHDPGHRTKLELEECQKLDGGCVYALYKVRR